MGPAGPAMGEGGGRHSATLLNVKNMKFMTTKLKRQTTRPKMFPLRSTAWANVEHVHWLRCYYCNQILTSSVFFQNSVSCSFNFIKICNFRSLKDVISVLKGPLQYLVAMVSGCHTRAILLPVGRKFFARFLASRRRRFKSPTTVFFSLRQTQKKRLLF